MAARTGFLARLIGLYCLLAALFMVTQRESMILTVTALVHDGPLQLVLGVGLLAAGLAFVLCHNVWVGGTLPVVVTVIGWLTLAKGALCWVLPPAALAQLYLGQLHYGELYYFYCAVLLVLGVYLTLAGFAVGRRAPR